MARQMEVRLLREGKTITTFSAPEGSPFRLKIGNGIGVMVEEIEVSFVKEHTDELPSSVDDVTFQAQLADQNQQALEALQRENAIKDAGRDDMPGELSTPTDEPEPPTPIEATADFIGQEPELFIGGHSHAGTGFGTEFHKHVQPNGWADDGHHHDLSTKETVWPGARTQELPRSRPKIALQRTDQP